MTLLWDSWEDQTFPWNPECFGQCFPGPQRDCCPDGRGRPRGKPSPGRRGHRALSLRCPLRDACRALKDGDSASLWRKSDRVPRSTKDAGFLSGPHAGASVSARLRGPAGLGDAAPGAGKPTLLLSACPRPGLHSRRSRRLSDPANSSSFRPTPGEPDAPALNLCVNTLT